MENNVGSHHLFPICGKEKAFAGNFKKGRQLRPEMFEYAESVITFTTGVMYLKRDT